MVGLLIVSHADISSELLKATEMIVGPVKCAKAVAVYRENSVEDITNEINQAFSDVAEGSEGVIIMTDMFGGTPTNLSLPLTQQGAVEIITGVNLPMIIKFFNSREDSNVHILAKSLRDYASEKITLVSELLSRQGVS